MPGLPIGVARHSTEGPVSANSRCSVLVVEDDESIAEFVESVLRDEGYTVTTAGSGEEGLRRVHSDQPDVILLDLLLPGIGGEAFLRDLREREGSTAPVILMTAAREAEAEGGVVAEGLLLKPFELSQLLGEVERVLAGRPCAQALP
jgi:DNA-binding response OmpR family regulator